MNDVDRLTQIIDIPPIYWQLKLCFSKNFFVLKDVFTEKWHVFLQGTVFDSCVDRLIPTDDIVTIHVYGFTALTDACNELLTELSKNPLQKLCWDNNQEKTLFFKAREQAIGDFLDSIKINSFKELLALVEVILENWDNIGFADRIHNRLFELMYKQIVKERKVSSLQDYYHTLNETKDWTILEAYPGHEKLNTLINTRIKYLNALKEVGLQEYA